MRVLVLGGTRFVGPPLVRELAAAGHDVVVAHRGEHEAPVPPGVRHVHGAFETLLPELRALAPAVVVDTFAVRAEHGRRVRAFAGVAERAVLLSSMDVYRAFGRLHRSEPGPPDPLPLTEDSSLRERLVEHPGIDPLDYDKTGVEREARADPAFPVTILRLPAVHGPGDYQHRLHGYLRRMDDGRPAILLAEAFARWRFARGYVEDVAHAAALAATDPRAAGRIYNVAEPDAWSEAEWVALVGRSVGWEGEVVAAPPALLPEPLRMPYDLRQDYAVASSRIRHELGYAELVPLGEALRRTVEWERANPPEPAEEPDYAAEDAALAALGRAV